MEKKDDWRLTNQENYLKNRKVYYTNYKKTGTFDHDHCAFCFCDFNCEEKKGYCTTDYYHWICEECYGDFKEQIGWRIVEEKSGNEK